MGKLLTLRECKPRRRGPQQLAATENLPHPGRYGSQFPVVIRDGPEAVPVPDLSARAPCCTDDNVAGHPYIRVTEVEIDQQVLSFFDKMRIEIEEVCEWVRTVLRSQTKETQVESLAERAVIQRHLRLAVTE